DNPAAVSVFNIVLEAKETLGDPHKKRQYDQFGGRGLSFEKAKRKFEEEHQEAFIARGAGQFEGGATFIRTPFGVFRVVNPNATHPHFRQPRQQQDPHIVAQQQRMKKLLVF
ncbi:hypothetical protein ADUPG1_000650, partial [Aduncisulcus paluster]